MTAVRPPPLALDTMVPSRVERLEERARARSGSTSIVKVEEVGHDSDDEMADKSAYPNVNVEWVNQKGARPSSRRCRTLTRVIHRRRVGHAHCARLRRQAVHRRRSGREPADELDDG
jgi:hypothetical protein